MATVQWPSSIIKPRVAKQIPVAGRENFAERKGKWKKGKGEGMIGNLGKLGNLAGAHSLDLVYAKTVINPVV